MLSSMGRWEILTGVRMVSFFSSPLIVVSSLRTGYGGTPQSLSKPGVEGPGAWSVTM